MYFEAGSSMLSLPSACAIPTSVLVIDLVAEKISWRVVASEPFQ